MIKAVIFDLDDTLYDEIDYCRSGFMAVARFLSESRPSKSIDQIFQAFWEQFNSDNRRTVFNCALQQLGLEYDAEFIDTLVSIYRGHEPDIELPTESREVLACLHEKYDLGLITDGFLPAQELKVKKMGVAQYFKFIVYTEKLGREYWKPSPAGYHLLLDKLDVDAENTVFVGDNEKKDFITPNQLGMVTIKLIRPAAIYKYKATDDIAAPGHIIKKLSNLPTFLQNL